MLNGLCEPPPIEKTRYFVEWKGHAWEIDVFHGDNEGLIVAEIELATADQAFVKRALAWARGVAARTLFQFESRSDSIRRLAR